jgi:4-hydroxy-3-polyprenylbenzoate decarboxylase
LEIHSKDLAQKIGEVVFKGKPGFGVPKILLVEDDIDITDVNQVVWAFSTRVHPTHGEIYFPDEPNAILFVYLDETERETYKATKVIHNCLLADRFTKDEIPVKGSFENG